VDIPVGIGIAFVVTLYVDGKKTDDKAQVGATNGCLMSAGVNKNEFFMECSTPQSTQLTIDDAEPGGSDYGSLTVPVNVTAQSGSVSLSDAGADGS
jgi:hypothetical protein